MILEIHCPSLVLLIIEGGPNYTECNLTKLLIHKRNAVAKRLCTGLQIRVGRFDSGPRLQIAALSSFELRAVFLMPTGFEL